MKRSALLLLFFQKDFFLGGANPVKGAQAIAERAFPLLQCFRDHGGLHIHSQLENRNNGLDYCRPSTEGIRIADIVAHYEGEPIVHVPVLDAFASGELAGLLAKWKVCRLILCGLPTEAVINTVQSANLLGLEIIVCSDACAFDEGLDTDRLGCSWMNVEQVLAQLSMERFDEEKKNSLGSKPGFTV